MSVYCMAWGFGTSSMPSIPIDSHRVQSSFYPQQECDVYLLHGTRVKASLVATQRLAEYKKDTGDPSLDSVVIQVAVEIQQFPHAVGHGQGVGHQVDVQDSLHQQPGKHSNTLTHSNLTVQ